MPATLLIPVRTPKRRWCDTERTHVPTTTSAACDRAGFLLVGSEALRRRDVVSTATQARSSGLLDIAALPALPFGTHAEAWPQRVASADGARRILALVHRDGGAQYRRR